MFLKQPEEKDENLEVHDGMEWWDSRTNLQPTFDNLNLLSKLSSLHMITNHIDLGPHF